jgi:hypothetical protein
MCLASCSNPEHCCMTVDMYPKNMDKKYTMYRCMHKNILELTDKLWIDDYFYFYYCNKDNYIDYTEMLADPRVTKRKKSGAMV